MSKIERAAWQAGEPWLGPLALLAASLAFPCHLDGLYDLWVCSREGCNHSERVGCAV